MITLKEARIQQKKGQKKSLVSLFVSLILFASSCVCLRFVGEREFYIGLYLSLFALVYIAYKVKFTEFFRPKEYEGEVTYFNVRAEQSKKIHTHQVGSKYDTYTIFVADLQVEDKKGKIRHKTFRYTKEYDNVKVGDRATVLRFVDKPIIVFKDEID